MTLSLEEGRYDRQELISWWDQEKVGAARVLVVGAGALGNEVVKNLALLGVGLIEVVDLDVVERSNLARCVFFRESDNGLAKAEVVARRASEINPEVEIRGRVADVTKEGIGWVTGFDLVIGALDNREARVWINQACRKMGIVWIDGAIEGIRGVVKVFPPMGACYECTLGEKDREILSNRRSCSLLTTEELLAGKVPTTATSSALISALQVQEAIRVIHGEPSPIANSCWVFTGETFDSYVVSYSEDEFCLAHDDYVGTLRVPFNSATSIRSLQEKCDMVAEAIDFEVEIVRSASCVGCSWSTDINRRISHVKPEDVQCQICGELSKLDIAVSLHPDDELVNHPLEQIGIPNLDIVTLRSGDQRVHYLLDQTLEEG